MEQNAAMSSQSTWVYKYILYSHLTPKPSFFFADKLDTVLKTKNKRQLKCTHTCQEPKCADHFSEYSCFFFFCFFFLAFLNEVNVPVSVAQDHPFACCELGLKKSLCKNNRWFQSVIKVFSSSSSNPSQFWFKLQHSSKNAWKLKLKKQFLISYSKISKTSCLHGPYCLIQTLSVVH